MADQVPLLKPSKDVPRCAGARSRMLKKIFKSKNKKSTKSRESAGNAKQTRRKPQKKSKKPKPKPRRATAARDGKQKKEPSKAKLKGLSPPKGDYPFGRRSREKESKGSGSKEKDGPIRRSRGKPCRRSGSEEREGTVRRSEEKGNKEGASKSKEVSLQTNSTMKSISSEEAQSCTFDKTQWERTRFAAEAVNDKKSAEPENKAQMKEETMRRESALLGESRQSVAVKGEYLTRKPMPTIVVLFTELLWSITCLMGWSIFADNPLTPTLLAIFNFILMSLLTLGCLSIEFLRYQVRREDNKSETRFFIPYIWRFSLFEAHLARAALLGANITIMVTDNDYDAGSVSVLVASAIQLIFVTIHIVTAVYPKSK